MSARQLCNPVTASEQFSIVVKFSSINKIQVCVSRDSWPRSYELHVRSVTTQSIRVSEPARARLALTVISAIYFDLQTPAILEKEDYYRGFTGDHHKDNRKFRQRLIALDSDHARIAPYGHHLRLVLVLGSDIEKFASLCETCGGIPTPMQAELPVSQRGMLAVDKLRSMQCWVAGLHWPTAFQLELLMHNGLVTLNELLMDLKGPIMNVYRRDHTDCADVLRNFAEMLRDVERQKGETALQCFVRVCKEKKGRAPLDGPASMFNCHRVTFTPTRLLLEGP
jgi:RNA-dependent RNA polymerase